jgi:hypothetical protein
MPARTETPTPRRAWAVGSVRRRSDQGRRPAGLSKHRISLR